MTREKIESLTYPDAETAADAIGAAINDGKLVSISCVCAVDYQGRASSFFGYCDCFVVIKPDGTFLIHQNEGRKPTNWQPPGCTFTVGTQDGELVILGRRESQNERVELRSPEVYSATMYDIDEPTEKELFGTEDQMQDMIMDDPATLEEGFRPVEAERSIEVGAIDIFGHDSEGTPTIVELKRRRAGPDAVDQLKRYVNTYGESLADDVRGVLVAPSFTDTTKTFLKEEGLEYIVLEPPQNIEEDSFETTLEDFE